MRNAWGKRLLLCLVCFAVAFGGRLWALNAREKKAEPAAPEAFASEEMPPVSGTAPEDAAAPEEAFAGEVSAQPPVAVPTGAVKVLDCWPNIPYQEQEAPEDYFADAAFVGNSLVEGLSLYTTMYDPKIDRATFFAEASLELRRIGEYMPDILAGNFGKIYLGFGLNEAGWTYEDIYDWYKSAIDALRQNGNDPIIYVMSLTPVSAYKSQNDSVFNRENVQDINVVVKRVAEDNGCYYMDLFPPLADADGYLPSDVTSDGVHFTSEYYRNWYEYLEHNYVLP